MGKRSAAKRPASGMNARRSWFRFIAFAQFTISSTRGGPLCGRNGELQRRGCGVIFLLVLTLFGDTLFAQYSPKADWSAIEARITSQITSGSTEQKRSALSEIRNLQTEKASRLAISALRDKDEIVRATAASSVVFLPKAEAIIALTPLLNDKAPFVRREAAYALGNVGSSEAAAPLLRLLQKEKQVEVRTASVIAFGQSGDPSAVQPLIQILKSRPKEETEFLRRSAARSIGQIAQIISTGKCKVLTPQNFLPDKFKDITGEKDETVIAALSDFTDAVGILIQVLKNKNESDDTRREAAFSLGAVSDKLALPALQSSLNSTDPYLAEISREAILKIERSLIK